MAINPSPAQIVKSLNKRFYSQPLLDNVYRGDYVETLILFALGDGWKAVGGWGSWDLEKGVDGVRVEVKQSAALQPPQPWYKPAGGRKGSPAFNIAPKTGYYTDSTEDAVWVGVDPEEPDFIRAADLYIFAWHPETDSKIADHRRAEQWRFFVVPEFRLTERHPTQNTIRLTPLSRIAIAAAYDDLAVAIADALSEVPYLKASVMTPEDEALCYATDEILELVRQGKMRVYSSGEVRAKLGLED